MNDSFSGKGELYYSKKYGKSKYEKNIDAHDEREKNLNFVNDKNEDKIEKNKKVEKDERNLKTEKKEKKAKVEKKDDKGEDADEVAHNTNAKDKGVFSR
jgi:hypothetical protein